MDTTYDYVVIGSGFGGSVSAMRLAEKGYSSWCWNAANASAIRISPKLTGGSGSTYGCRRCAASASSRLLRSAMCSCCTAAGRVGSLGYANVLMEPDDRLFDAPASRELADWKTILKPHYETAKRMLGVARNPKLWPADHVLEGSPASWAHRDFPTDQRRQAFPGPEGEDVPDPYFGGEGPTRTGCQHCGGCMVGCRYNAEDTTVKNYLYFAEKWGAEVARQVQGDRHPPAAGRPGGRRTLRGRLPPTHRAPPWDAAGAGTKMYQVSAGAIGTLKLLLRCRDVTRSLPNISPRLQGDRVRTNNEALLGVVGRGKAVNFSKGVAITSIFQADDVTQVEPVRYPAGSSLMRFLAVPLIEAGPSKLARLGKLLARIARHPMDSLRMLVLPGWASRTTILLVMQTEDDHMHVRLGRHLTTLFRRGLVSSQDAEAVPAHIKIAHDVVYNFAAKTDGAAAGSVSESLLNTPMTAHIMGGVSFGRNADEGVIDLDCQVFNYPGLSVADNSIIPANPGVNPSLTCTALAEYAMSRVPPKPGFEMQRV